MEDVFVISDGKFDNAKDKSGKGNDDNFEEPAHFETAIRATGFGKFNLILLLIAIPSGFASIFSTTAMSYILPIAHCDLDLTLNNKGMLNAVAYTGMISSAFGWGYLADTIGRKKLLVFGYLLDACLVIICGFSQQYTMLVVSKFMTGFMKLVANLQTERMPAILCVGSIGALLSIIYFLIINGPYAALMSYMNEFHAAKHRAILPLANGVIRSLASIVLPLLGWLIFTDKINISLFNGFIVFRSWNIFLFVCALPSLIAGIAYTMLPESPKFLMTTGDNEKALEIFKKIYAFNTGKAVDTFPIKILVDETTLHENDEHGHGGHVTAHRTKVQALKEGWQQLTPLCYPPYIGKMLVVFTIQFGSMMGLNSLRLWLPQLFTAINDYQTLNEGHNGNLCDMLATIKVNTTAYETDCFVNYDNSPVYTNNILVALATMGLYLAAAPMVRAVGKKTVLISSGLIAGVSGICMYFALDELTAVALSSVYSSMLGVVTNLIVSIVVDIFPTTLRTMAIALTMMCGRSGAMIGNLIFPALLMAGCLPPFMTIGCLAIGSALFTIILPKTDMQDLE